MQGAGGAADAGELRDGRGASGGCQGGGAEGEGFYAGEEDGGVGGRGLGVGLTTCEEERDG